MGKTIFLKGATIISGHGNAPIENGGLLIDGERIARLGPVEDIPVPEGARIVDLSGRWLLPGLINTHVHIIMEPRDPDSNIRVESVQRRTARAIQNLGKYLRSGVTFLRDADGPDFVNIEIRKCLEDGIIEGPGLVTVGKALTITGGHGKQWARECDGREEVRKAVREQVNAGSDIIKVIASNNPDDEFMFTREEIEAAVEEAHRARKKTMAHATSLAGIKNAVFAGVESIEHASVLDDEVIEAMLERGTYIVPTLSASYFGIEYLRQSGAPARLIEAKEEARQIAVESFRKAYRAGVKIAFGTDSGTRLNLHENSAFELALMAEYAMTPMEAIVASTRTAAELLGIDHRYGTLEEGKAADIVVLEGNPLQDIRRLQHPAGVYKSGKRVV